MVSLKEIAKKVGVAPSTVSFVLNGKDKEMRISGDLARRIKAVAKKEGYRPNQVAISLRTGKSKIIGLVVDMISGSFFASLARIIEKEMEHHGYKVIYCSTGNDLQKGEDLIHMLYQHQVDGFLIIPTEGMEKDINMLMNKKKPLVLMDSYFPGTKAPYVLVNNYDGVSKGVSHFIKKGYSKIGFVCNDLKLIQMQDRKKAYIDTVKSVVGKTSKNLLLTAPFNDSKEDTVQQIRSFLQTKKPQAVMFAANYLGVCGLEAIKSLGLKIPDDVAVICFDDHELFTLYTPEITVIRQPVEEIAQTAVAILIDQMGSEKKIKEKQLLLKGKMIERMSV